ncbi:hypothetical protein CYMTET_21134 [Cymbomonas tetramitiformis]|uniref:Uncharacterized protein n=1 Tax=Cymbomonas tetramitiformis TaxID=36881 RepID=A0AAE0G2I5_9CHLO|nr:hypothetical protein CYMTET_21134 [Cymbomonas tetramitiformis]
MQLLYDNLADQLERGVTSKLRPLQATGEMLSSSKMSEAVELGQSDTNGDTATHIPKWSGTLFNATLYPVGFFVFGFIFAALDSLLKINSAHHHFLWGNASSDCGADNTLTGFLTVAALIGVIGTILYFIFAARGKYFTTIQCYKTHIILRSKRCATMVSWEDVMSAREVVWNEVSMYRSGSVLLEVRSFERVELSDGQRDGCCGFFGWGNCFDWGLGCGVYYFNAEVTHTTTCGESQVCLFEVPNFASRVEECCVCSPAIAKLVELRATAPLVYDKVYDNDMPLPADTSSEQVYNDELPK